MHPEAKHFIEEEKAFQLGFLPTECSNALTVTLEDDVKRSMLDGIATLQLPDRQVEELAYRLFAGKAFENLQNAISEAWAADGRVIFSGCGATGRLAILLESICRRAGENKVASIMTGGDYALIRAVEFFEDFAAFGARQTAELQVGDKDVFVAITEGGETSSVLGSLQAAVKRKAKCFLVFNNPADILATHLERSREMIEDPLVEVIELFSGPMALAGSTRLQATTAELLVIGGAVNSAIEKTSSHDYAGAFSRLLDTLEGHKIRQIIAEQADFELNWYRQNGLITYYSPAYLLDIFTDTAERTPTFSLPGFRKKDDKISPPSWAYACDLWHEGEAAWADVFQREPRCLDWSKGDYEAMNAANAIAKGLPQITMAELLKFDIGSSAGQSRQNDRGRAGAAVLFALDKPGMADLTRFDEIVAGFAERRIFAPGISDLPASAIDLFEHLAVKLVWNTLSTVTMVGMGRVRGNWMSAVSPTNKKLIDRSIRLVAELGKCSYTEGAELIFRTIEELSALPASVEKPSCVELALARIKSGKKA